jgi:AcrR family transcriptional regulator
VARVADPMAKSKLLRAAREEFAASGLAGARIEDIAKRAALAKGSFYLHFKSKEEAFLHVVNSFFSDLAGMTEDCTVKLEGVKSVEEFRVALVESDVKVFEFCWQNRDVVRVLHESGHRQYEHLLTGFLDALAAMIERNIVELQRRGLYRKDVDAKVASWAISGAYNNLVRHMTKAKTKPDLDVWIQSITKLCTSGLATR